MANHLLVRVPLQNCRDLLLARQRARQIAQLLRFPAHDVSAIAAGVFLVANSACLALKRCELCISVGDGQLLITAEAKRGQGKTAPLTMTRALPRTESSLAIDDIAFVLGQMDKLAPPKPRDELARMQQELLGLLADLRDCQARTTAPRRDPPLAA